MSPPLDLRELVRGSTPPAGDGCGCEATIDGTILAVQADRCRAGCALEDSESCRATVVDALANRAVDRIAVRARGWERSYGRNAVGLFEAAGRFAVAVRPIDARLADRTRRDPVRAAREATGRTGEVAGLAADTGLAAYADGSRIDGSLLDSEVGPTVSDWRVDPHPPAESTLERIDSLETRATVRVYEPPGRTPRCYHLEPESIGLDRRDTALLDDAYAYLANAPVGSGDRAAARAVRAVAPADAPIAALTRLLRKHTKEPGLLLDFFADPAVSDVYVTAPATRNTVRVQVDGETLDTNVTLTADGVAALASRFRRESGQGFSRATPTLDTATEIGDRRVRIAGVTEPVSDGHAFAFRAHDRTVWTLADLVANDTLTGRAAGLLSLAVERGAATLVAGPRASGKTTLLGALLWEIPPPVRTVVIEDAPELPVRALQSSGRDVQGLQAEADGVISPANAVRTALRLGDGALVVGEVRGEEAAALYEAMRVGANSEAVLGTIHGDGADAVLKRVVSDLGVSASAFAATDLLVTLETARDGRTSRRRVRAIEEVVPADPVAFATLFERTEAGLSATGRIERGNSQLVAGLTPPTSTYADTLGALSARVERIDRRSTSGETSQPAGETPPIEADP